MYLGSSIKWKPENQVMHEIWPILKYFAESLISLRINIEFLNSDPLMTTYLYLGHSQRHWSILVLGDMFPDIIAGREIETLSVRCPKGCSSNMQLKEVQRHCLSSTKWQKLFKRGKKDIHSVSILNITFSGIFVPIFMSVIMSFGNFLIIWKMTNFYLVNGCFLERFKIIPKNYHLLNKNQSIFKKSKSSEETCFLTWI